MTNPEYFNLEFDVSPEPGRAQIESFFDWAKNEERPLVREVNGTEQVRLRSESGYQLLLVRPDADHQTTEAWQRSAINKDILMRTHIAKPDTEPWAFAWGVDNIVEVEILELTYTEGVGYLLDLPTRDKENGVFPLPPSTKELIGSIYAEQLYVTPWDS
ncbi:MAG TPA: hypothetical protein VK534_00120 [Methylomirabilota bacterium]|nr:hypothetical protein [Methylomirabilota bacterium]